MPPIGPPPAMARPIFGARVPAGLAPVSGPDGVTALGRRTAGDAASVADGPTRVAAHAAQLPIDAPAMIAPHDTRSDLSCAPAAPPGLPPGAARSRARAAQPPALAAANCGAGRRSGWSAASTASCEDPRRASGGALLPRPTSTATTTSAARRRHRPRPADDAAAAAGGAAGRPSPTASSWARSPRPSTCAWPRRCSDIAPTRTRLDDALYARPTAQVGLPRLRAHQIDLIRDVGDGLGRRVADARRSARC